MRGNVLAAGGASNGGVVLASAEVYSPSTSTWTPTGSLATARLFYQMVLLPDGNSLAAGGDDVVVLASTEVYSSATGNWSTTGSLIAARRDFQMVLLLNNDILAAGGQNGVPLDSAELFSLGTGSWTTTGSLATADINSRWCSFPTATFLLPAA